MPFDINDLNPGEWFEYPGDTNPPERIKLRFPDNTKLKEINKQTVKTEVEHVQPRKKSGKIDGRRPMQRIEYEVVTDEQLRERLLIDYVIVDWEIRTPAGEAIECTTDNKMKMMFGSVEFNNFVNDCLETLKSEAEKESEDREQNLLNMQSGHVGVSVVENAE